MTGRRIGLLLIALLGVALIWAAAQSVRTGESRAGESRPTAVARDSGGDAGTGTLQFFRTPAAAPALSTRDLSGREVSLASLRGKVVLINFWATWCPPCRAEIPDLVALQEKYRDQLQIIGISEDEAPMTVVQRFADEHHMNYPIVMASPEIEKLFPGVGALPTTFVIDRGLRWTCRSRKSIGHRD